MFQPLINYTTAVASYDLADVTLLRLYPLHDVIRLADVIYDDISGHLQL